MKPWKSALCLLLLSCSTKPLEKQPDPTTKPPTVTPQALLPESASPPASLAAPTIKRRLYVNALEASSFLNQKKSLIWDRYHPNYAMDGDPASAWNEGAETSGAGEWLRVPITKQEGLTALTLRIMNGYQKSEALFQANTRAKTIQVTLLPGGQTRSLTLEDKLGWQELTIQDLKADVVEAIELKIVDVYEGGKYKDLCISEIELFATSTSKEAPEAEATKQKELLAWAIGQQDALALLKGEGVLPAYEVEALDSFPGFSEEAKLFIEANKVAPMSTARLLASKALFSAPSGFSVPCGELRGVDIYYDEGGELETDFNTTAPNTEVYTTTEEDFSLPCFDSFSLFTSVGVSAKDKKETKACDAELWVPTTSLTAGGLLRQIDLTVCGEYTEHNAIGRPGEGKYSKSKETKEATQTLLYDEAGRLRVIKGPNETLWFDWTKQGGRWVMSGGLRDSPPARLKPVLQEGTSLPAPEPMSLPNTNPTSVASAPASKQATPTSNP